MTTIFLDSNDVLLIDYLQDKTTMNRECYANLLLKLFQAIKDKHCGILTRGVWLVHPVHKSMIAQQSVCDCGFVRLYIYS